MSGTPQIVGVSLPVWCEAGLWGLLAGGALVVGAAVAWFLQVPRRVVASVMAFGSGVLISALSFTPTTPVPIENPLGMGSPAAVFGVVTVADLQLLSSGAGVRTVSL